MSIEIELKYSVNEAFARQLLKQQHLGPYPLTHFQTVEIVDRYYDTANGHLAQKGYALRLRKQHQNVILQLKSLTTVQGALHRREELNIPVQDTDPDHWPNAPATELLKTLLDGHPMQELLTIHQRRHVAPLLNQQNQAFAQLSLDEVLWKVAGHMDRAWELEIELLPDADETQLQELERLLEDKLNMRPQPLSKFERGLALVGQSP
jgi:inorganic triphosphatase YgiF